MNTLIIKTESHIALCGLEARHAPEILKGNAYAGLCAWRTPHAHLRSHFRSVDAISGCLANAEMPHQRNLGLLSLDCKDLALLLAFLDCGGVKAVVLCYSVSQEPLQAKRTKVSRACTLEQ